MCLHSMILILQDTEKAEHVYNNSGQAILLSQDPKVLFKHSYMWWATNDFKIILYCKKYTNLAVKQNIT